MKNSYIDYFLRFRLLIILFVAVTAFAVTYFVSRAERDGLGYAPEQPIKYSHALHAGKMQIDCQYCHMGVEKGRYATIPAVSVCMNCHTVARKDKLNIKELTRHYDENIPLRWKRVHRVPDYAYFSHVSHIGKGIECRSCHGDVEMMETLTQVHSFTMGECISCHRNAKENLPYLEYVKNGPDYCWACHR